MPIYYPINEATARQAKAMNSFSDYKPGSATAEYRSMVDEAAVIAEEQKARTDPMYHEKIDRLLDTYARKLADNLNESYSIQTRCPSILLAGGSNFPVRKKEKQNAAADRNMEEFRHVQGLLDKIRSTGMGGISSDDEKAIEKLREKLAGREREQAFMKEVNAYYRKNKTLEGCPGLTEEAVAQMKAGMERSWRKDPRPYESFILTNNNAEIHRLRGRIEELEQRQAAPAPEGWTFNGGKVVMNTEENRVQILFDGKPEEEIRSELKHSGFRWSPRQKAWQRQLNQNGIYAARQVTQKWMLSEEQQEEQSEYREEQEPQSIEVAAPLSYSQQMM